MRGEHEAELGDPAAQRRAGLEQVRVEAGVGQVDGGAHAADAAADDENAVGSGWLLQAGPLNQTRVEPNRFRRLEAKPPKPVGVSPEPILVEGARHPQCGNHTSRPRVIAQEATLGPAKAPGRLDMENVTLLPGDPREPQRMARRGGGWA